MKTNIEYGERAYMEIPYPSMCNNGERCHKRKQCHRYTMLRSSVYNNYYRENEDCGVFLSNEGKPQSDRW